MQIDHVSPARADTHRHVGFFSLANAWWVYKQASLTPQGHANNFGRLPSFIYKTKASEFELRLGSPIRFAAILQKERYMQITYSLGMPE